MPTRAKILNKVQWSSSGCDSPVRNRLIWTLWGPAQACCYSFLSSLLILARLMTSVAFDTAWHPINVTCTETWLVVAGIPCYQQSCIFCAILCPGSSVFLVVLSKSKCMLHHVVNLDPWDILLVGKISMRAFDDPTHLKVVRVSQQTNPCNLFTKFFSRFFIAKFSILSAWESLWMSVVFVVPLPRLRQQEMTFALGLARANDVSSHI